MRIIVFCPRRPIHAWNGLKEWTRHQQSIDVLTVTPVANHLERNKKEQILEFLAKEVKWIKRDSEGKWITTYNQYLLKTFFRWLNAIGRCLHTWRSSSRSHYGQGHFLMFAIGLKHSSKNEPSVPLMHNLRNVIHRTDAIWRVMNRLRLRIKRLV